ncbi:hypothetical protein Y032_0091g2417 [Ancylostoma ceylanicum]|uniref:Uncharacterized protein n=1 Tax=Ancylostoma ceylanicum TaxID=53326 RepID=A0A016TML3_9BILA|nr:hypothetical protein Y032_0091g2417 [Ancylostoma ceylanicum]
MSIPTADNLFQPWAWLEQIISRWDGYFKRFDRFFYFLTEVRETQNTILNKLKVLEEQHDPASDLIVRW